MNNSQGVVGQPQRNQQFIRGTLAIDSVAQLKIPQGPLRSAKYPVRFSNARG